MVSSVEISTQDLMLQEQSELDDARRVRILTNGTTEDGEKERDRYYPYFVLHILLLSVLSIS